MQTAMASSERIFKLLDNNTLIPEAANPVKLPKIKGKIEFRNVCFAYSQDNYVLKNINF